MRSSITIRAQLQRTGSAPTFHTTLSGSLLNATTGDASDDGIASSRPWRVGLDSCFNPGRRRASWGRGNGGRVSTLRVKKLVKQCVNAVSSGDLGGREEKNSRSAWDPHCGS